MEPNPERPSPRPKDAMHPEVQQVLKTLKSAVKILGYTVRDLERELGYSYGYLSRVFAGSIELKIEHVIEIAGVLKMEPAELWAFIYPELKDPASPAAFELWKRIGGGVPSGTFVIRNLAEPLQTEVIPEEALEKALRRTFGRVLGEVVKKLDETREDED